MTVTDTSMARLQRTADAIVGSNSPVLTPFVKQNHLSDADSIELTDTNSVELNIKLMDSRYKTSFYNWLKSESNNEYIVHHLKRVIFDYDLDSQKRALKWLFEEWDFRTAATCLIKLYYEKGINETFAEIVAEICVGKAWSWIEKLIMALVIGEDQKIVGEFLYLVTEKWDVDAVCELFCGVASNSHWNAEFMEGVLCAFAEISCNKMSRKSTVPDLKHKFVSRVEALVGSMNAEKFALKYCLTFNDYTKQVLKSIVEEDRFLRKRMGGHKKVVHKSDSSPMKRIVTSVNYANVLISPASMLSSPTSLKSPLISPQYQLFE